MPDINVGEGVLVDGVELRACGLPLNWEQAQQACECLGYDGLVSVTSEAIGTAALGLVADLSVDLQYWIGLNDRVAEGQWVGNLRHICPSPTQTFIRTCKTR